MRTVNGVEPDALRSWTRSQPYGTADTDDKQWWDRIYEGGDIVAASGAPKEEEG